MQNGKRTRTRTRTGAGTAASVGKKLKNGFPQPGCWNSDCRHPLIGFLSVGVFIYGSESLAGFSGRLDRIRCFTGNGRGIVDGQQSALYGYRTTLHSIAHRQYVLVPEIGVAAAGGGASVSRYIDWMSSGKACRIFNKEPMKSGGCIYQVVVLAISLCPCIEPLGLA